MAAKGAIAKKQITDKILSVFPNSFLYNDGKEIRINTTENGELIQIKVALTAAKAPVSNESDEVTFEKSDVAEIATAAPKIENIAEPTDEEKERLAKLLNQLGLS